MKYACVALLCVEGSCVLGESPGGLMVGLVLRSEQQGGKARWTVLSWLYKLIGVHKTKVKKSCKVDTRFFDAPTLYSQKRGDNSYTRDSLASISKSISL